MATSNKNTLTHTHTQVCNVVQQHWYSRFHYLRIWWTFKPVLMFERKGKGAGKKSKEKEKKKKKEEDCVDNLI